MSAYVMVLRDILRDADTYERYKEAAMPTLANRNVRFLAGEGRTRILEGASVDGAMIIEFPDFEAVEAWFDSAEYQKARRIREGAVDLRIVLIDGLQEVT